VGGSILNQFSPAPEGSTEVLEVNWYSPPFAIGAAPSVDKICFFRDPMLPGDVFFGPWRIQAFHLPPPIRQIPPVRGAGLIVWSARKNSKAGAGPGEQEEGITPRPTTAPHRGGKKPVAVIWKRDPRVFLLYQESSEQSENGAS